MGLWIERAATEMPAVRSWQFCHLDEAVRTASDLKWTKTEERFGGGGEGGVGRTDGGTGVMV